LKVAVAVERIADGHDHGTLHLRAHAIGVDDRAAIDRQVEPRYRDLAVIADCDMHDGRHIGQKAAMHRDATTLPRRQFLASVTAPP
jgi:hypothetical protein